MHIFVKITVEIVKFSKFGSILRVLGQFEIYAELSQTNVEIVFGA